MTPIKHYELSTVTYGTSSAPFLSVRVLDQLANDHQHEFPTAARILKEQFYVDDVLTGAPTEEELIHNQKELIQLMKCAGMELGKWVSNSSCIADRATSTTEVQGKGSTSTAKDLVIHWDPEEDTLSYKVCLAPNPDNTKRQVLSGVARIFDPLGILSPVVMQFKILFQELWLLELPPKIADWWNKSRNDLHILQEIRLPRFVENNGDHIELHGFSDASIKAYSAVIYCRVVRADGTVSVSLIAGKTRVAPLKQQSLPGLELYNHGKKEVKYTALTTQQGDSFSPIEALTQRVSSCTKLVHVVAYALRFIQRTRTIKLEALTNGARLTLEEIQAARILCLREAQKCFMDDRNLLTENKPLRSRSQLIKLSPFVCKDGLLRVEGRLANSQLPADVKHPILLPKSHRITRMILEHEHTANLHPGVSALFVFTRQKYWIFGARNLIRNLVHNCVKCDQFMADLPRIRITEVLPFQHSGCDYAGPFILKERRGRNPRKTKSYICLFVCLVTSAIHLELATDLSTLSITSETRHYWQHLQSMYQGFWKRWHQENLTSLQQRQKWNNMERNIAVGSVVLVKDSNLPPASWILARVLEAHQGPDGLVRAVKLKTSTGEMTRPITKLAVLPNSETMFQGGPGC
ncbi:uncharacterized protein [Drosophila takahashii]|uniref:uncharacterized protein n=1 Tax=Drosophila takahashii TaxID=29030 RepID=UPI00389903A0